METFPLQAKLYKYRYSLLIPLLGAIFALLAIKVVDPIEYANSDFFSFWLSGRMAIAGQNPYVADGWIEAHHEFDATWISDETFLYPLPLSLFFAPLGFLSLYQAFLAWAILSQFMIFWSVVLVSKAYPATLNRHLIPPLFVGIVLFRPTIVTLHNGQLTALLLLAIASTVYFWEKEKWWQGSVFLPILALKPNLGIPIILLLVLYLLRSRQIIALGGAVCSGLILLIAGLAQNPNWIFEFWNVGHTKLSQTFGFSPTVWGVSAFFCRYEQSCTLLYGAVISLFFLIGSAYLITRRQGPFSPTQFASLVITIVLLLTPYTWPYDQLLLLIPILTVMLGLSKLGYPFLPIALLPLILDAVAFVLLGVSVRLEREYWNAIIPLLTFILLIWYLSITKPAPFPARAAKS